jgi:antitoxin component YwqK of YwqJK toxin-antitoxin module
MGQPACIFYENGRIIEQHWYKKGVQHRDGDLPAYIHYYNGQISFQCWYKNGK